VRATSTPHERSTAGSERACGSGCVWRLSRARQSVPLRATRARHDFRKPHCHQYFAWKLEHRPTQVKSVLRASLRSQSGRWTCVRQPTWRARMECSAFGVPGGAGIFPIRHRRFRLPLSGPGNPPLGAVCRALPQARMRGPIPCELWRIGLPTTTSMAASIL